MLKTTEAKVMAGIALGIVVYAVFAIASDAPAVGSVLGSIPASTIVAVFALSAGNYVLRWVRWEIYLRALEVRISRTKSVLAFLGGFAMTVSPGKVGEVFKSYLLLRSDGIPAERTAPIVVAERLTDVLALVALVSVGLAVMGLGVAGTESAAGDSGASPWILVGTCAALCGLGVLVLSRPTWMRALFGWVGRLPKMSKLGTKLEGAYDAMSVLTSAKLLVPASLLALVGWSMEAYALSLLVGAVSDATSTAAPSAFVYAFTTLAGAISFLPGGLGVTEASMGVLLRSLGLVSNAATATAVTVVIRVATLWFAVAIGLVSWGLYSRLYLRKRDEESPS